MFLMVFDIQGIAHSHCFAHRTQVINFHGFEPPFDQCLMCRYMFLIPNLSSRIFKIPEVFREDKKRQIIA